MSRNKIKNFIAVFLMTVITSLIGLGSVAAADNRTARDYMDSGIRAAYDNMHLIYKSYYDENGELEVQPGGYVAVFQEWDRDQLLSRTYLDENCQPVEYTDGYSKAVWGTDEDGRRTLYFYDATGQRLDGVNILWTIDFDDDGWSDWMKPKPNKENYCFTIGYADLGEKKAGDKYKCSVEIEFRDVTASDGTEVFNFRTQGATDGQWIGANVWNGSLMVLDKPIENVTKEYQATVELNEIGAETRLFELGFRCDYWGSGEFRVRDVKVERIVVE